MHDEWERIFKGRNPFIQFLFHQQHVSHSGEGGGGDKMKEICFHVPTDLVGMAIGREGANVNEARRIRGVKTIEFDDYSSMFSIKGEVSVSMFSVEGEVSHSMFSVEGEVSHSMFSVGGVWGER